MCQVLRAEYLQVIVMVLALGIIPGAHYSINYKAGTRVPLARLGVGGLVGGLGRRRCVNGLGETLNHVLHEERQRASVVALAREGRAKGLERRMPHDPGRQIQQFSARPSFLRSSCRRRSRVDGVEVYLAFVETCRPAYARDHPLDVHTLSRARDLAAPS